MNLATIPVSPLAGLEAAVAEHFNSRTLDEIGAAVGLNKSNVCRRVSAALHPAKLMDAFTGRHLVGVIRADYQSGGRLMAELERAVRGESAGDAALAPSDLAEMARRKVAIAHRVMEAVQDGVVSPEEAAEIAALERCENIAATSWLANLDALAVSS